MVHDTHPCPICGTPTYHTDRYPRAVCSVCVTRASDGTGRRIVALTGAGFSARYADAVNGVAEICAEVTASERCWIEGVECSMREDYWGGVVVESCGARPQV